MPRHKLSPAEAEANIAKNIELFAARMTLNAWNWKNIDPWQRELLRADDRYIHVNCSRQSGKSSTLSVKAFHKLMTIENALVLIVAEQRQSNEDMRKLKELTRAYDKLLLHKYNGELRCTTVGDNATSVEFASGARCISLPANDKIRGYSAPTMVWIDEAHYVDDPVFISVEPMIEVSPTSQLIMSSTPNMDKGKDGFFFFESKNSKYRRFEAPWQMCPRISKESIEEKRTVYGAAFVETEYECQFLEGKTSLFTEEALNDSFDDTEDAFTETMKSMESMLE